MAKRSIPQPEQTFLQTYDPNQFERPSVTTDVVMLTVKERQLNLLIVQRDEHPYRGEWSLPGGFVGITESLTDAAARVLRDKTGLEQVFLEQLYTFGQPDRDPRTRVITVSYYALVSAERLEALRLEKNLRLATVNVPWAGEIGGPVSVELEGKAVTLAFDHQTIVGTAIKRLRGKLDYAPVGFQLLPERFTLRALQDVHETILGREVNKDSFRRRMQLSGQLEPTGDREEGTDYRPAEYYVFKAASAL